MAKMIDVSEADFSRKISARGTWLQDEWLNGEPWILEGGVDFDAKAETVRTQLYGFAAQHNMSARAKVLDSGDVVFQAYHPTAEEKAIKVAAVAKRNATRQANAAAKALTPADSES